MEVAIKLLDTEVFSGVHSVGPTVGYFLDSDWWFAGGERQCHKIVVG